MNIFEPIWPFDQSNPDAPVTDSFKATRRQEGVQSSTLIQYVD